MSFFCKNYPMDKMNTTSKFYLRCRTYRSTYVNLNELLDIDQDEIPQSTFIPSLISRLQHERTEDKQQLQRISNLQDIDKPGSLKTIWERLESEENKRDSEKYSSTISTSVLQQFAAALPPYDYSRFNFPTSELFQSYEMSAGIYLHFGISTALQDIHVNDMVYALELDIGFYVYNVTVQAETKPKYLVIFGRSDEGGRSFVIGLYYGDFGIPMVANEILQPLVAEIKNLQSRGVSVCGSHRIAIDIRSIVCDPMANSVVTCVAKPNTKQGCAKCMILGVCNSDTVSFPSCTSFLRSNQDFVDRIFNEHHFATPIIVDLGIEFIGMVSIDYKHTVCLGLMKNLLELWMTGDLSYRFSDQTISAITAHLEKLVECCPLEFKAKPKPLAEFRTWTGYDYRQFLLYYGPIVLMDYLPRDLYSHFLQANVALRILLDKENIVNYNYNIAGQQLQAFVHDFAILYGSSLIDYNIHNLLHLEMIAAKYHSLETVGGFVFDAELTYIEDLISKRSKNPNWQLTEMAQIISWNNLNGKNEKLFTPKNSRTCVFKGMALTNAEPDNYVLTKKGYVKIKWIGYDDDGQIAIHGRRFLHSSPLTNVPTTLQNVRQVFDLCRIEKFDATDIITKSVVLKAETQYFAMPLLTF